MEDNIKHLKKTLEMVGAKEYFVCRNEIMFFWRLLKDKYPKMLPAIPVGKKDQRGNIITSHIGFKKLYLQTYKHRLRNRPIKMDFEEILQLRTDLFNLRLN